MTNAVLFEGGEEFLKWRVAMWPDPISKVNPYLFSVEIVDAALCNSVL